MLGDVAGCGACDLNVYPAETAYVDLDPSVRLIYRYLAVLARYGVCDKACRVSCGYSKSAVKKGCRCRIVTADSALVVSEEGYRNVLFAFKIAKLEVVIGCVLNILRYLVDNVRIV